MTERRNFYRVLYAQPDAPLSVIKTNHRVLMQKLQRYADQDLADEQACLLNTALTVLQDPLKRAVYDHRLRKRYPLSKLSLGRFASGRIKNFHGMTGNTPSTNRRNYYRILQVQTDASMALIISSYSVLLKYPLQNSELLDDAFAVLANPVIRIRYDALLAGITKTESKQLIPSNYHDKNIPEHKHSNITPLYAQPDTTKTLQHCIFCYTPFANQPSLYQSDQCLECSSPLPSDQHDTHIQQHRFHRRINVAGSIVFYLFWPDSPYQGILQDISPKGARFLTETQLDLKDIIKIDAPGFKAVAEIVHTHPAEGKGLSIGARFLTIKFTQDRGNFIVANA